MLPTISCSYCKAEFKPRPQTRNPKACQKKSCQKRRQYENERHWRERGGIQYGAEYHQLHRKLRNKVINEIASVLAALIVIGAQFKNVPVEPAAAKQFFADAISSTCFASAKKLWGPINKLFFEDRNGTFESS